MSDRERIEVPPELNEEYDEYVDDALSLVRRELSPARETEVRRRMATDPMYRRVVEPILDAYNAPRLTADELAARWAEFRARAGWPDVPRGEETTLADYRERVRSRERRFSYGNWKLVAVMVFLLLLPFAVYGTFGLAFYERFSAPEGSFASVRLPDGTTALLAPGARIEYMKRMARTERRNVDLDGEATFVVERIGDRFFHVWTDHAVVVAVGTRFTVHESLGMTRVAVQEGRVTVQGVDGSGEPWGAVRLLKSGEEARVTRAGIVDDAPMTQIHKESRP